MNPKRVAVEMALAAAAGFCAYVLPVALDPDARHYEAAFLPFVRDAVEGVKPYSLAILFAIGVTFGLLGRAPVKLTGPATMAAFPVWSVVDMALGGDHNLIPIEWFFYGIISLCGLAGAVVGRRLRLRFGGKAHAPGSRTAGGS
jgi:hypothetical protein